MKDNVRRIHPEAKTSLIKWIEEHFHEIDEYVATFSLKSGETMTIYDASHPITALGLAAVTNMTIRDDIYDGEFVAKERS